MSLRNYYESSSSSYGRNRDTVRNTSTTVERPTSVTAKYINSNSHTPSYKSSSIPILSTERIQKHEEHEKTPIATIQSRYANYNKTEKPSLKYEKKDYTKLNIPSITIKSRDASRDGSRDITREVSPISTVSKYSSLSRPSRHLSPERRITKSFKEKARDPSPGDREKDIPSKTDKSSGYNGLSSYKLYPRSTNYTRPMTRADVKPDITVNRYAIANRLNSTNYLRSPPTVKRPSVSPVLINHMDTSRNDNKEKSITPTIIIEDTKQLEQDTHQENIDNFNDNVLSNEDDSENETITIITRHTSPTPPGSSSYVRSRRAELAKTIEKTLVRVKKRPEMVDKEVQSDRLDDPTRTSRFGSTARTSMTNWSYYSPSSSNYTGYAGRYSTQYTSLRDNSSSNSYNDRSSRSHSTEHQSKEDTISISLSEINKDKSISNNSIHEQNRDFNEICNENKDVSSSEIIINVNLKLKRAKSPVENTELISPEVTITNSQLPPQAPKTENTGKTKKSKIKKSGTDSSTDSGSKKKILKRRSKSVSSTDSDQGSEISENTSTSPPRSVQKTSSTSNLKQNGPSKLKHSKSRDSNSPESSITLSTQSSISEDETISKSKTQDLSRTSANEISIQTDHSDRQPSPSGKNEGTEEAKSFLIRALAPVTNLFKMRNQDSSDNSKYQESSSSEPTSKDISNLITESEKSSKSKNIIASNEDGLVRLKSIRSIESEEGSNWSELDSEKKNISNNADRSKSSSDRNLARKIRHVESGEQAWWQESNGENNQNNSISSNKEPFLEGHQLPKKSKFVDEEKPWWLDSSANIPEGIERLTPPRNISSDSDKNEKFNLIKVRRIESGDRKDWWLSNNDNSLSSHKAESHSLSKSGSDRNFPLRRIRHIESGERPWWLSSNKNIPEGIEKLPTPTPEDSESSDEEIQVYIPTSQVPPFPLHLPDDEPLGDRRSPEGLEMPRENEEYRGRTSPYENNRQFRRRSSAYKMDRYISRCTDIDDILGMSGQIYSPFMDSILARRTGQKYVEEYCEEIDPTQVRIHDSTAQRPVIKKIRSRSDIIDCRDGDELDDAALQVYKDGDYGPYLDLDSTLGEQDEEIEGLQENRKNSIVLRTQLSVRVNTIIERLLHSQGRELRRELFTLKQILQSDKDLVHEFVANKGLDCLMQVGSTGEHNYLDYVLRALGQIFLYVDGMHGVMEHKHCVRWLYSLISSKFRHVVKTALKLLLVLVEYTETNCLLIMDAIATVDISNGHQPWYNIMKILQDVETSDTELIIYATTLINRCLNTIPDKNTYYDQVDALLDQGMDDIIQLYMSKQGTDLDLLRQLQIFQAVLLYEDGDDSGTALKQLDEAVVSSVRRRSLNLTTPERRKSKKQQSKEKVDNTPSEPESKLNGVHNHFLPAIINKENKELSTALRRRRDRFARQAHHITQQQEMLNNSSLYNSLFTNGNYSTTNGNCADSYTKLNGSCKTNNNISTNGNSNKNQNYNNTNGTVNGNNNCNGVNGHNEEEESYVSRTAKGANLADVIKNENQRYTTGLKQRIQKGTLGHSVNAVDTLAAMRQQQLEVPESKDDRGIVLNMEHSIKDIAQRLTIPVSPTTEEKQLRVSDMAGIVSKAKEELAKSQSKEIVKSPAIEISPKLHEMKVPENELEWEAIQKRCINKQFQLCDLDFTDLRDDSDDDMSLPAINAAAGPPPPPPVMFSLMCGIPPPPASSLLPEPLKDKVPPKPPLTPQVSNDSDTSTIRKNKKTVKLFWREIQPPTTSKNSCLFWDTLPDISLDTNILEHLFEAKTNDLVIKKLMEPKRTLVLDPKRSNAINIGMKKLPTPLTIKAAILKMDATVIGREGIEKLMTMLPTEEEKCLIQEAQLKNSNTDLPLGSAEQFLLTLASINELPSRLKLWAFKLDFDNLEKEIAEPLMDLKQGIELLKENATFKIILSTLRSMGSFLNGTQVKGFRLEYLSKVMEVKDTVQKHPLLYHVCDIIMKKFPNSSDFFSEVGPVIRSSKVDFDDLNANLQKLEADCKASWDHMKRIAKHDNSQMFKTKITEFLLDAAERIVLLTIIRNRVMKRFRKLLAHLGVPPADILKTKPSEYLKVIAEFALEYRTTRERVLQQTQKKANHRERNKTRGKMIIDIENCTMKGDSTADNALKALLTVDPDSNSLTERRRKKHNMIVGDISGDDEIIESLVRSAMSKRRTVPRESKKDRLSDKKTFSRTRDVQP